MAIHEYQSPVGVLKLETEGEYLQKITFVKTSSGEESSHPVLKRTCHQLSKYFEGEHSGFDLPLQYEGTEFQKRVWQAVSEIPYGKTVTYLELAKKLGNANAIRAVGRANGQNPIPIVIPCHRVVGANGKLVGYSGGIDRKQWLLRHEGALLL